MKLRFSPLRPRLCGNGAALRQLLRSVAVVWTVAWLCQPASAEAVTTGNVTAELISEQETIRPGAPFTVAVVLHPSPGWHTYWQNPGDSGLPTRVSWKLPAGFRAGELEWPHPVRLGTAPLVTFGYQADAVLLTRIDAPDTLTDGSEASLVAAAAWLACREDACVPGKAELPLRIRVDDSPPVTDSRWCDTFDAARSALPRRLEGWTAVASDRGAAIRIEVTAPRRPPVTKIDVFSLVPGVLDASATPEVKESGNGFVVEVARDEKGNALPQALPLVLVADGGWDSEDKVRALRIDAARGDAAAAASASVAAEVPAPVAAATPQAVGDAAQQIGVTFWAAIALAVAGGLILNLMPCVFPVLSLKVLGFVHVAHHRPAIVRRHGYAYTAGVISSFWVLAAALLILRAAGGALGWGFQLQEPLFVAAMAALLLAMALNLFGVFEIGTSIAGAVGRFDSESGYRGSFLSGVLATLLATPCTAPFMGTAIGYALVQPPSASIAVFTALGVGMASPYLVLACAPLLIRRLPRPGAWMQRFREAMAFPLLASVAWLVWVFGQQTGNDGVLRLLLALLVGSMAVWLAGRAESRRGTTRTLAALCAAAAIALAASASERAALPAAVADASGSFTWQAWDPDAIGRHRSEGRVVFVDFTADWCLSCKVNERVALTGADFARSMSGANAIAMKADWTSADPRITGALADFGRSGVPLYVVYPRDPAREPIVLPQILTPAIVREALERAVA